MKTTYILEPYQGKSSRFTCPNCGQSQQFARYIDPATGQPLADHVGRCNRENRCGYHYSPKQFFADNSVRHQQIYPRQIERMNRKPQAVAPTLKSLSRDFVVKSLTDLDHNNFVQWLCQIFTAEIAFGLVNRFKIGTSRQWPGATVFWQIDQLGQVRAGKVMLYNPDTGKRMKTADGRSYIDWVHSILIRKKLIAGFELEQCFFGEHQLKSTPKTIPVAIVESEKTAVVASVYSPKCVWLATGQLNGLSLEKFQVLSDRTKVLLYPDLGLPQAGLTPFQKWSQQAQRIKRMYSIDMTVSDVLERYVTNPVDRENGSDLADYLIRTDPEYGWALQDGYPVFWDSVPYDSNYDDDYIKRLL